VVLVVRMLELVRQVVVVVAAREVRPRLAGDHRRGLLLILVAHRGY